jgi:hypothetical protein
MYVPVNTNVRPDSRKIANQSGSFGLRVGVEAKVNEMGESGSIFAVVGRSLGSKASGPIV